MTDQPSSELQQALNTLLDGDRSSMAALGPKLTTFIADVDAIIAPRAVGGFPSALDSLLKKVRDNAAASLSEMQFIQSSYPAESQTA